jgi:hypothetical protein
VACVVAGTVRKAPPVQARWILKSVVSPRTDTSGAKSGNGVRAGGLLKYAGESEIGGYVSQASSVTSPLFGHISQHNIPHTSLNTGGGGGYTDLLHTRSREARQRSSSTQGLSSRRVGGLLQLWACPPNLRRRSQMAEAHHHASGSFCPCNCWLAMS